MSYVIKIFPADIAFDGESEKTLLDSALEAGIHLEHSCKNGSCGICEAQLIAGEVIDAQDKVVPAGNNILTCSCRPGDDVSLQATYYPELAGQIKKITPCKVVSAENVSEDVIKLVLRFPPTAQLNYLPGQYINLQYQGVTRSYSIANADAKEGIELHIRNVPNGQMSQLVFGGLTANTLMRIEGPCGTFFIRKNERPVIFIAGGTGFAPVKAMVESLLAENTQRKIYIYWGMQYSGHFYSSLPRQWASENPDIHFIPVVSGDEVGWQGRKGFVHNAVVEDFDNLEGFDVYACGSPVMIEASRKDLMTLGLPAKHFYSDAFTVSK
ncbi:CDP-6-deoxy-delta-3,4-glucoseen reductase [Kosakonia sacchari]|uniref:CDP-6-deoxy-delta-3,4-glucoseen reductase n=1 Tax=Kosakonia sacchari TaxID=1158459 RepID=UPI002ACD4D76|nr:CDP-6-deoxy-delta-3,4-glucoseen reductase [Kosakonia sacchari]MDZ7324862.1 CDP-6-deoxy-delta-3,4-glucoseen reductase [Kosakonia sacchari]